MLQTMSIPKRIYSLNNTLKNTDTDIMKHKHNIDV